MRRETWHNGKAPRSFVVLDCHLPANNGVSKVSEALQIPDIIHTDGGINNMCRYI